MRHEGGVWLRWVRRRREGGAVLCRHTGRSKVEQNDLTRVAAVLVVLAVAKLADRPDDRLRHAGRDRRLASARRYGLMMFCLPWAMVREMLVPEAWVWASAPE